MKIDGKSSPPAPKNNLKIRPVDPVKSPSKGAERNQRDRVTISQEAKALHASLSHIEKVESVNRLIDKMSLAYPDKDFRLNLKEEGIEIEAKDPILSTKLSGLFGKLLKKLTMMVKAV